MLAIYSTVQYSTPVLNFCKFLTLVLDELQGHVLHKKGVEFHQESNGHGPRHVTRVCHVSTRDLHVFLELLNPLRYRQV